MFDKFKSLGALAGLMANQEKLAAAGERLKNNADRMRCTGQSGNGAVKVTVNGRMRVVAVELASGVSLPGGDAAARSRVAEQVREATNDAMTAANQKLATELEKEAKELGLGGTELGRVLGSISEFLG